MNLATDPFRTRSFPILKQWFDMLDAWLVPSGAASLSYPVFMPKHYHMHDAGSIVPHIRLKVFTDNQMS
jgi:hypothetical protein